MTREDALTDVVTVIRLVPLGGAERASGESAIVANFGSADVGGGGPDHERPHGPARAGDARLAVIFLRVEKNVGVGVPMAKLRKSQPGQKFDPGGFSYWHRGHQGSSP